MSDARARCETIFLSPKNKRVGECVTLAVWRVKTTGVRFPMLCCDAHLGIALERGDRHTVTRIKEAAT